MILDQLRNPKFRIKRYRKFLLQQKTDRNPRDLYEALEILDPPRGRNSFVIVETEFPTMGAPAFYYRCHWYASRQEMLDAFDHGIKLVRSDTKPKQKRVLRKKRSELLVAFLKLRAKDESSHFIAHPGYKYTKYNGHARQKRPWFLAEKNEALWGDWIKGTGFSIFPSRPRVRKPKVQAAAATT